jgi:hypothetical protein
MQLATASVHRGAVSVPPAVPPVRLITAPWHHVAPQLPAVVPALAVHVPFWRFAFAAPVNPTWLVPSKWVFVYAATSAWQVWHEIAFAYVPATRCRWCAPTRIPVDCPAVSTGGAAFSGDPAVAGCPAFPWQLVHVIAAASTTPFTCVARFTVLAV